jgi:plasmid stability protein
MPNLLVRDLDKKTIDKLKRRAERHNTSLQAEAKTILEESSRMDWEEFKKRADAFREKMIKSGRTFSDTTDMVREDRER